MQRHRLPFGLFLLGALLWSVPLCAQEPSHEGHDHDHDHDQDEIILIGPGHSHDDDPTMGGYQNPVMEPTPAAGSVDNDAPADAQQGASTDSTRRERVIKPLESYFFDDSIRARTFFTWTPDLMFNSVKFGEIDTAIHDFQSDYPFLKYPGDVGAVYQGNLGGAAMPVDFNARPEGRDFSFARAWRSYLFTPQNVRFYNVKRAYTQLSYATAGQKKYAEDHFTATHAQNVTPSTGFAVDYRSLGAMGIYAWQRARQKNLATTFYHTGKKYTLHAGYLWNKSDVQENGGIEEDFWVTDTILELTENIPVRLRDAKNTLVNNTFFLVHSYGVPLKRLTEEDFSISDRTSFYIGQSTEWSRYKRTYSDTKASSGGAENSFYDNWDLDPNVTADSLAESLLANRVFIQLQPWGRGAAVALLDAGVGMDIHTYDIAAAEGRPVTERDYYGYAAASGRLGRYAEWGADARLHPAGDRSGDVEMGAHLALSAYSKGRPLRLEARLRSTLLEPAYWDRRYLSNHFTWENSFNKEQLTRLELDFRVPHLGLELGAWQSLMTDRVYYDSLAMPAQAGGAVSVTGLRASKRFAWGILRFDPRVLVQWSSDEQVVPLPTISAFAALYLEFNVVRNVLRMQLGLDGRYNTRYYAPGYMPATAQFYNQHEKQIGGYPLIDAFVAAKWKRMRILLKMEHVNDNLLGTREYFTALHYPLNKRVMKLGISWAFYD